MRRRRLTPTDRFVLAVLAGCGAYDLWAITRARPVETISACVRRHGWISRALEVYLIAHFEHLIPARYDPLRRWTVEDARLSVVRRRSHRVT